MHRIRRWWERTAARYDSQSQGRPINRTREMCGRWWVTRCRSNLNRVGSIHIKCPVGPNARSWELPMPTTDGKVTSRSGNRQTCTTAGPSARRQRNHTRFCRSAVASCQPTQHQQAKLPNAVARNHLLQHSTGAKSTREPRAESSTSSGHSPTPLRRRSWRATWKQGLDRARFGELNTRRRCRPGRRSCSASAQTTPEALRTRTGPTRAPSRAGKIHASQAR